MGIVVQLLVCGVLLNSSAYAENPVQQNASPSVAANFTNNTKAEGELLEPELQDVITSWASAWQSQLDDVYFLHYHPDYRPEGYANVSTWRKVKGGLIRNPKEISINLHDFAVVGMGAGTARVRFWMDFAKPGYSDKTKKEVVLKQEGQLWLIAKETNLEVIEPASASTVSKSKTVAGKGSTNKTSSASNKSKSSKGKAMSSNKSQSVSKAKTKTKAASTRNNAGKSNKSTTSSKTVAKSAGSTNGQKNKVVASKAAEKAFEQTNKTD